MHGILFDLDGTLLALDLDAFLRRYFKALQASVGPHFPGIDVMPTILASTEAMQRPHPLQTNKQVFDEDFKARTGIDLGEHWHIFEAFYRDVFPTLGDGYGPARGAREAIEAARALGLKVAVATQPIFPASAIAHRLAWAGLDDVGFDAITTYETMHACKPLPGYFEQTASMIGCAPSSCLMVGDDRAMDLPASAVGMRTYYVGDDAAARTDHRGSLEELPALLERLMRSATA
ncbi:MAG TPA: HAD family hydrolase [Coriobacteriia bacterium]